MSALVYPSAQALALVTGIVGAVPWSTAKIALFNNNFTPSKSSVLADFTPAVYSGYAPKSITWSAAFFDSNGVPVSSSGELLFQQAGATGDNVYGAYITDAAGAVLLASGRLDLAPFLFVNNGDTLPLLLKYDLQAGILSVSPVP